jgi:hypothetical protein
LAPQSQLSSGGNLVWNGDQVSKGAKGVRMIRKAGHAIELVLTPGTYELIATHLLPDTP